MQKLNNKNLQIAIIGASSQVGSSVALYLRHFTEHEPICFIRSKYSSIFFEMANIKTVDVDINNTELLKSELQNVDVVLDFSLPAAEGFEMLRTIKKNLNKIISATPSHAVFIYMSSIMAYGMPSGSQKLRYYSFPRALYGFIKRKAEKHTRTFGDKYNVQVYNFRLGQVHGFMQSVSESFIDKLSSVKVAYVDGQKTDLTNAIFISTLSEAIIKCGFKEIRPATYTLVSYPQWTLKELYGYYLSKYSLSTKIIYHPRLNHNKNVIKKLFFKKIKQYRPFIETYILTKLSAASISLKGKYRMVEIHSEMNEDEVSYIDQNLTGTPSGRIVESLKCTVSDVTEKEVAMENLYYDLLKAHTNSINNVSSKAIEIIPKIQLTDITAPRLSVIIPTYKRSDSLLRVLQALKGQEGIILEIIVVDQNPPGYFTDELNNKLKEVIHIVQEIPNASLARNTGFNESKAPYILFLDDDLIPEKDFCKKGVSAFKSYPDMKSFVPLVYTHEGEEQALRSMKRKIIKSYPNTSSVYTITEAISAAIFFERTYFKLTGGFDSSLFDFAKSSEDMELCLRMQKKNLELCFCNNLKIFHDEKAIGGCDLRTSDYWLTRKKIVRGMAYRLRSHNINRGEFTFFNFIQILRSFVINRAVLKSGLKNIIKEFRLVISSIRESKSLFREQNSFPDITTG